jgi:glycosyltransferase involved in cell wall biosynthesis
MPRKAYLAASIRREAIEKHFPGSARGLRAWVDARLEAFNPDVILANQPFAWGTLQDQWHDRTVLDTHNVNSARLTRIADSIGTRPEAWVLRLQALLSERFELDYVRRAAETWVVSSDDAAHLNPAADDSVRVIPNGCDVLPTANPAQLSPGEPVRLLFLGSLGYSANLDALRRLTEWAKFVRSDFVVTVAGSGDSSEAMRLTRTDSRFEVVGRVADAKTTMQTHHALVAPHTQGGGSRIKILEALGTRTPIIASRVAAEGSGAEPGSHYLAAEDGQQFAAQLSRLRDTPAREEMTNKGFALAETFDWDRLSEQVCCALTDVVRARGQRA